MRTSVIAIILSLFLGQLTVCAQENILRAFDVILGTQDAIVDEKHTLEKDSITGTKEGQSDVYSFVIAIDKLSLITDVLKAFGEDNIYAFNMNHGLALTEDPDIKLAIGQGDKGFVINEPGYQYAYSCFMAPVEEDPDGHYRYAYGLNFRQKDGAIEGNLVITYGLTTQYRKELAKRQTKKMVQESDPSTMMQLIDMSESNGWDPLEDLSWIEKFTKYVDAMDMADNAMHQAFATKIYKHAMSLKKYKDVTSQDKYTAREVLGSMLNDKKYNDKVTKAFLSTALAIIK